MPCANWSGSDQFWVCTHSVPLAALVQPESCVPGMVSRSIEVASGSADIQDCGGAAVVRRCGNAWAAGEVRAVAAAPTAAAKVVRAKSRRVKLIERGA
ncbi:hypothetical protein GCM10027167_43980 [Nocardia heshunensis]